MNLMSKEKIKIEQARKMLIQQALDDVRATPDFSDFYLHAYYVIAKLGLQLKAREESLFESEEWSNLESKDNLMKKIGEFLIKHVK